MTTKVIFRLTIPIIFIYFVCEKHLPPCHSLGRELSADTQHYIFNIKHYILSTSNFMYI